MASAAGHQSDLEVSAQRLGAVAVGWVLLDSMLTYFSNNWFGVIPPVNFLLTPVLLYIVVRYGVHAVVPPGYYPAALAAGLLSYIGGKILTGHDDVFSLGEVAISYVVFLIAYFAFRWSRSVEPYGRVFLWVSMAYVAVCVAALSGRWPSLLPVVNAVWSDKGAAVLRPEITTDQNFQIFYLFPVLLVLALPYRTVRTAVAGVGAIGALYVLAEVQSRSGFLVYCAVGFLVIIAPWWTRSLGRGKTLVLPVVLVMALALKHDAILHIGSHLIARFTENSGPGTGSQMGEDRIESSLFSIQHLLNPEWWLPRGSQEFINRYGFLPHSTMTAFYLEGGILGLLMWLTVFVFPLVMLGIEFLRRRLDALGTVVLLGGLASFAIQMSLYADSLKHIWLWAGAVLGTLCRVRSGDKAAAPVQEPQTEAPKVHETWVRASAVVERARLRESVKAGGK